MEKYTHADLVNCAIETLKSFGFNGSVSNHSYIALTRDTDNPSRCITIHEPPDGIYTECQIHWRNPKSELTGRCRFHLRDIEELMGQIGHDISMIENGRRNGKTVYKSLDKHVSTLFEESKSLKRLHLLPRIIDVVGIQGKRRFAVECGNTRYAGDDYPSYFNQVFRLPYPKDGSELCFVPLKNR